MRNRPVVALALCVFALATSLASARPLGDQRPGAQPDQQRPQTPAAVQQAAASAAGRHEVATANEEKVSQTSHVVRLDGRDIKYTATAGTLPIRLDDGKVAARMFFVAYTKDGEDAKTRPVSFLYNGGPGSASVWLHMGSFAPRKAQMADEGFQPAPPYQLVDNESSLIDVSDLVFVDAIDTGFSRATEGVNNAQFHDQEGDIRAFGEFIAEYLKTYSRWPSPKFLIGESYGTIRSAGLSQELQTRHGIELNGIVLVSSLLTYQTLSPAPNNDVAYAVQIETFAATAWYHKRLAGRPAAEAHQAGGGRGAGVRVRRLHAGAHAGQRAAPTPSAPPWPRSWPASPGCRRSSSWRRTCASTPAGSGRNCCATSA